MFRDVIIFGYFGIKDTILMDNARNILPGLKTEIRHIIGNEKTRK